MQICIIIIYTFNNCMNMLASILLFGMPSGGELIVIALIVLLLFGAKKLPELARGTGRAIREFKDATKEIKNEIDEGEKAVKDSTK